MGRKKTDAFKRMENIKMGTSETSDVFTDIHVRSAKGLREEWFSGCP